MNLPANPGPAGAITPAVHLEFIQNQAGLPENAGLEEVDSFHRALFLHHHATELEQCQQQARTHEERLAHLEARLASAREKIAGLEPLIPVSWEGRPDVEPTPPWNSWDLVMFGTAAAGIAILVIFGVLNISFNLLESGLVTFVENPVRAYFWAALLPVGALAVKIGWDLLQSQRLRVLYVWSCLAVGLAGVLSWLAAYAAVYPSLSKSTTEHLESLSVYADASPGSGTSHGVKWIDALAVVSQATAEIFLSATLGIYMTTLYHRHRPVRLAGNPVFVQQDEGRRLLEQSVERERQGFAQARGNQSRLENQLAALLSFARSQYHKEANLRQDQSRQKRLLLDQISERLRTQLEGVENGNLAGLEHPVVTTPSRRHNGA